MPVHDWTRVDAGLYHNFHQRWISALHDSLNAGVLPPDYYALAEQSIRGPIPDLLTLRLDEESSDPPSSAATVLAVRSTPPRARLVQRVEEDIYLRKADRIVVRHRHGDVVAVIEIVSPGNKGSKGEFEAFVKKTATLIKQGIHVLVVDPLPPTKRDPQGIHKAIWDEFRDEDIALPAGKPLTVASYDAGPPVVAYIEPFGVGDPVPDMPLFLRPEYYVLTPLEATYQGTWSTLARQVKRLFQPPQERSNGSPGGEES